MAQYLITLYRNKGFNPEVSVDENMLNAIKKLNADMVEAGVRIFVGGLKSPDCAKSIRLGSDGDMTLADGLYLDQSEFVDGLWVIDVPDMVTAEEWARKAVLACRASVEIRPFYG